jgi:hypothetical protein
MKSASILAPSRARLFVWFVIVIATAGLAFVIGSGLWMTTLLVFALIPRAFAVVGAFSRLP